MCTGSATRQRRGGGSCVLGQEAARTIAPSVSQRTRTHGAASVCKLLHVSEIRARRKARDRVKCFAQSLADLPAVDASAVRNVALKDPVVTWVLH
eukprot:4019824-Prymnesium_polylepis.1